MTVCVAPGCGEIVPAVPCGFAGIAFSATVEPGDFSARDGKPTGDVDAALCSVDSSRFWSLGIRAAGVMVGALETGPVSIHIENTPTSTPNVQHAAANFVLPNKIEFARILAGAGGTSGTVGWKSSGRFGVGCDSVFNSGG